MLTLHIYHLYAMICFYTMYAIDRSNISWYPFLIIWKIADTIGFNECEAKILQTNWIVDCCILARGKWKVNVAKIDNNNLKRVCYHSLLQLL